MNLSIVKLTSRNDLQRGFFNFLAAFFVAVFAFITTTILGVKPQPTVIPAPSPGIQRGCALNASPSSGSVPLNVTFNLVINNIPPNVCISPSPERELDRDRTSLYQARVNDDGREIPVPTPPKCPALANCKASISWNGPCTLINTNPDWITNGNPPQFSCQYTYQKPDAYGPYTATANINCGVEREREGKQSSLYQADIYKISQIFVPKAQCSSQVINVSSPQTPMPSPFFQESDPTKVVTDQGVKFVGNEIIILLKENATEIDAQQIAKLVNGKITGFVAEPVTYKIELLTNTAAELRNAIQIIKNSTNPLVIEVLPNLVGL